MQAGKLDQGEEPNVVWRYLYKLDLRPQNGFLFRPEPERLLRVVLRGNLRIECRYGGDVNVTSLILVRDSNKSSLWRLAPQEVERTLKLRKVPDYKRSSSPKKPKPTERKNRR